MQATGSSAALVLGAAVIADISTPMERGGYMGIFGISLTGTTIGPVIGGAMSAKLGWRSIFYFLTILAGVVGLFVLLFLPETLRGIVGNGSVKSHKLWHMTLLDICNHGMTERKSTIESPTIKNSIWDPFKIILDKDTALSLFLSSMYYSVYAIGTRPF
jgi:MFS family permease